MHDVPSTECTALRIWETKPTHSGQFPLKPIQRHLSNRKDAVGFLVEHSWRRLFLI